MNIAYILGESRGFGFVKMDTTDDANAAIDKFNGTTQEGKVMTVAHVNSFFSAPARRY
jgi:RNA recognition motif-containing protein